MSEGPTMEVDDIFTWNSVSALFKSCLQLERIGLEYLPVKINK